MRGIASLVAPVASGNRHLVSDELWGRLVGRIVKDENMERSLAERIMDQALGFLRLIAANPGSSFGPSPLVDIGWHTFILYTRHYAAFCAQLGGGFIHHEPSDQEGIDYGAASVSKTVAAMKASDIAVDEMLWTAAASCNTYCTNSCSSTRCTNTG